MTVTFRPITLWPGEPTARRLVSRFQAGYQDTLDLLTRELRQLGASGAVVQLALQEKDIRRDGWPRAGARPTHPGVIVAFESRHGPLSYPCDRFTDWESNLRAIALSLEALRAVDRYGVTRRAEQYRGWQALPEGGGAAPGPDAEMGLEEAAELLTRTAREGNTHSRVVTDPRAVRADLKTFELVRRAALSAAHPDSGGSHDLFLRVRKAVEILKEHHGQ